MTQSMRRWMLAAVIAAAMVIASAGMGVAATIALDDDGADFESVSKQKLIDHGIEISDVYDVSEVTLINGKKFTVVKGKVDGGVKLFTIDPNGEISHGVQKIIGEKKKAYSQLSKAEIKFDKKLQKIAKGEMVLEEEKIPVFISVIDKKYLQDLKNHLRSNNLTPKAELQNYLPGISADVNVAVLNQIVELDYVSTVYFDSPLEMFLDASVPTIRVNGNNFPEWTDNTLGSGVTVAIVDNGIDIDHPSIRNNFREGTSSKRGPYEDWHGTAIAGIIASNDETYKGVAPNVSLLDASHTDSDPDPDPGLVTAANEIEWALAGADKTKGNDDDADIISMSVGEHTKDNTKLFGLTDFVDEVVFKEDIVFVAAVGQGALETVVSPAEAYNVISVGAIDDHNDQDLTNDILFESQFFGTFDRRQKPDILAPGVNIFTTMDDWEGGTLFNDIHSNGRSITGTSYATPHVAGVAAILLSTNPDLSAKQVKAILLNTANKNPSWFTEEERARAGYGLVNANEANRNIDNSLVGITTGQYKYYKLTPENGAIVTTMVWERHARNRNSAIPNAIVSGLSDLDMYLYKEEGNSLIAKSASLINNVEQIVYESDSEAPESYVLKIDPKILDNQEETFALAYYGTAEKVTPPLFSSSFTDFENIPLGSTFTLSLNTANYGDILAHDVKVNLSLPEGISLVSGSNPVSLGNISPRDEVKTASWVVRAESLGTKSVDASISSISYGETFNYTSFPSTFDVFENTPPNQPNSFLQWDSIDRVNVVPFGGTTNENTIILDGLVFDPDNTEVQLEVEVKPIGTAFIGIPTCISVPEPSDSWAVASCSGLTSGQYHWQARARDSSDAMSPWVSAGGNPETSPDFEVVLTLTKTYTFDADFDQGELVGLEHDTVHDQLQLTTHVSTDPIMWIANAGEDTISKWDTENNIEIARYHTWFGPPASHGAWDGPSPSRTAVDADGNGYVANRHFDGKPADVIKILAESWIDRNGNGVMDTSYDANNDGRITPDEMLPMTDTNGNGKIDDDEIQDERIAWVVSVGPVNGLGRSLAIDTNSNIWLGLYNTRAYYKISGVDGNILAGPIDVYPNTPYGALVDKNGILWGASLGYTLLKLDTNTNTKLNVYDHSAYNIDYGIALGYDEDDNTHVYQGGRFGNTYIEFDSATETFSTPAAIKYSVFGIATDANGNIVASNINTGGVTKFAPDGSLIWSAAAQVSSEARGTVVDSDDNVWVIHRGANKLSKFRGSDGTPLCVFNTGLYPYTYSDATGLSLRGSMGFGTWTVIYDSESAGTSWGRISWNSDVPAEADIDVQIRTGETEEGLQLATYQLVSNGNDFSATGRYIQIKTRLTASPTKESPILYDLTVEPTTENSISGTKFNDSNGNGIRDTGESGVSGVGIRLIRMLAPGVESFVSSTTTDGNGYYNFMGLQPGSYKIEEELSGFSRSQTFPADGSPHYINFEGTAIEGLDFGNQPIAGGEIRGTKFNDSNGNGVQDIGELGMSGVKICLWPSSRYTTTDESGNYIFPDVPVSTQTVYEIVPSGYASTTPSMVSVTVNTGEVNVVNFGNRILIPPPPDITVSGATVVDGVPQVFNVNPVVIQKDLAGISNNVVAVKLTLEWSDGTTMTMDMAEIDNANIWQATFSPPFPQGVAQMTFEVDVDPAGNWPGPEDAIQMGDIVFLDPSGQIIDTCTDNPIDGATVTLLVEFPPTSGNFIVSPTGLALPYQIPDVNPQITGPDGMYGWMTVPGNYKVRAEKAGYISAESIVVNIPPAVTGLDIGLTCINQPPVAIDKEVNTDEDAPLLGINVLVGCTDPDGDTLSVLEYDDTSTTGLVTFNVSDGTFDYDPDDQFEYLNGGETATDTFTFTISDGKGGTDTATVTITINGVNDAPEISLSNSMGTVQYSNGIEEFTISATDVDSPSLTLSTSWVKDGGVAQPDLPANLILGAGVCTTDHPLPATCVWTIEGQAMVDAGDYDITFTVNDGVDEIEAYTTLIVEPEDAAVLFDDSNPVAVQVVAPGGNSEAFSLTVDVTEAIPDEALLAYPGDITLAEVSVSLVPIGPGSPAEPTSCSLGVVGTGYDAILTLTFGFNDVAVNTYAVQVTVDGGYYIGSGEDVVVIYDPSLGFTTGGGTFLWPETGEKTNFGYTMKYNKKATNIKGNLLLVRHLQDGAIYRVKSNALYGLALGEYEDDGETYGWASFSGKSTYLEPGWDEPIGNYEFITYVEDHGEPGKNIDRIWIKIMNLGNTVDVMSMDDPGANNAVELSGGNIVVPHNANR